MLCNGKFKGIEVRRVQIEVDYREDPREPLVQGEYLFTVLPVAVYDRLRDKVRAAVREAEAMCPDGWHEEFNPKLAAAMKGSK